VAARPAPVPAKPAPAVPAAPPLAPAPALFTPIPLAPAPRPAVSSPYVPPELDTPGTTPVEEQSPPPEEVTPEEEAYEEAAQAEEPAPEEPSEEAPEESAEEPAAEDASEVELGATALAGRLAQHVRKTIRPVLRRLPAQTMQTREIAKKANAVVAPICRCAGKHPMTVRRKLDQKMRKRGYPAGAADKLLAGIHELNKRLDKAAQAKAKSFQSRGIRSDVFAKLNHVSRTLPLHHPVRCRAVRMVLTCTP